MQAIAFADFFLADILTSMSKVHNLFFPLTEKKEGKEITTEKLVPLAMLMLFIMHRYFQIWSVQFAEWFIDRLVTFFFFRVNQR